jgi:hypothetical protein
MTVVQLHVYKGVLFEKGGAYMSLIYCDKSRKIIDGASKSHPFSMFMHKDIDDVEQKLIDSEWVIAERYKEVEL